MSSKNNKNFGEIDIRYAFFKVKTQEDKFRPGFSTDVWAYRDPTNPIVLMASTTLHLKLSLMK